jgi:hypothetical protein
LSPFGRPHTHLRHPVSLYHPFLNKLFPSPPKHHRPYMMVITQEIMILSHATTITSHPRRIADTSMPHLSRFSAGLSRLPDRPHTPLTVVGATTAFFCSFYGVLPYHAHRVFFSHAKVLDFPQSACHAFSLRGSLKENVLLGHCTRFFVCGRYHLLIHTHTPPWTQVQAETLTHTHTHRHTDTRTYAHTHADTHTHTVTGQTPIHARASGKAHSREVRECVCVCVCVCVCACVCV